MSAGTTTNSSPSTNSSWARSTPDPGLDPHQNVAVRTLDEQESIAGSQYTSIRYSTRLRDAGAVASIGTVADSYDNAMAESVVGLYKTECTRPDGPFRGVDDLELATCSWVAWFNSARLHSAIGYFPPIEYETAHYTAQTAGQVA